MSKQIKLEVFTPSEMFFSEDVRMVVCNTTLGKEGFMADHTWACKLLSEGELWIRKEEGQDFIKAYISDGYIDIKDTIKIFADDAKWLTNN